MRKLNVLVTAVGGDIGQSIVRILRRFNFVNQVIGTDMSDDNPAILLVDSFHLIPKAQSKTYLSYLEKIVKLKKIDCIIPVSETELKIIYQAKISYGWEPTPLIIPNAKTIALCQDKFETIMFLKKHKLPTPWTVPAVKKEPKETPCILKGRWGWGSKSLVLIEDLEAARFYRTRKPQAIFQEKLMPEDEEYTCGIFRSRKGETKTIVFKRKLEGGQTKQAIVVKDNSIEKLCKQIAKILELRGSINLQLIKTAKGPVPFEINPRFSSTVMFRELLGFKDVYWSILDVLEQDFQLSFSPPVGTKIYRIFDEVIIPSNFKK